MHATNIAIFDDNATQLFYLWVAGLLVHENAACQADFLPEAPAFHHEAYQEYRPDLERLQ